MKPEECRKVDISLEMILRQYKGNGQFLIGSKLVELPASDIQFIFGIICGNKKVSGLSCSKNKVKFARRKGLQRLDQQGIKHLISEELLKNQVKYIEEKEEEQNEIEQEVIFIEEEEDEEQEGDEKKEQVKEEEDDENNEEDMETKEMLEEGGSAEEGDSVVVEQVAEEGNAAAVEQVTEEVDAAVDEEDEGDSAEEGDSVQKLSEEGGVENGDDSEMDDIFHTAEIVDEQIKSTNQSASTFIC
ncbi:hypothetical protein RHMOL_Rhmol05G0115400 [Rhododendron molle]|uniref:Uncharacterized protein n=1 Tax=Rhododendron molle TaxID=49168 RepID=A0ACC0NMQ6_RHOML|nr:hypothetical protein RHMOL_Rhmol05G0115400 [Rhododendron molle]